jgi:hypothetical protein
MVNPPNQLRNPPKNRASCPALWTCVVLLACTSLHGQENCDLEAKLLLSLAQAPAAVVAFDAKRQTTGHVYFYDTKDLDLLSHGVIVRLRQGADNDLTVKLRPTTGQAFSDPSAGREDYKCEVDLTGSGAINSYSIRNPHATDQLPQTGREVLALLSAGQKKLLEQSQVSVDWTSVKRVATIRYTAWQITSRPQFNKLTLELWEWPKGKVLELSTKVGADTGPSTYTALQQLVKSKGLSVSTVQGPKTSIVLKRLGNPGTH